MFLQEKVIIPSPLEGKCILPSSFFCHPFHFHPCCYSRDLGYCMGLFGKLSSDHVQGIFALMVTRFCMHSSFDQAALPTLGPCPTKYLSLLLQSSRWWWQSSCWLLRLCLLPPELLYPLKLFFLSLGPFFLGFLLPDISFGIKNCLSETNFLVPLSLPSVQSL